MYGLANIQRDNLSRFKKNGLNYYGLQFPQGLYPFEMFFLLRHYKILCFFI